MASAERAGSSSEAAVRSWVSGMSAVWANMGRAAAKGPTPKDLPKDFFDVSGAQHDTTHRALL